MLFMGNLTVMLGVQHYWADIVGDNQYASLGIISLVSFCFLVVLFECFYRRTNSKADMVVETPTANCKVEGKPGNAKMLVFTND